MNGKYNWLTLTTADMGYPMRILYGEFYNEKSEPIASIPSSMYLSSQWWSGDSGVMITGEEYKEVPTGMKIKWFSHAEDKFYEGDFVVDKERITQLFDKGIEYNNPSNEYSKYPYIKVAIAPAGQVYLYLEGGNNVLVGAFVAKEVFVDNFKREMRLPIHTEIERDELIKIVLKNTPLHQHIIIVEKHFYEESIKFGTSLNFLNALHLINYHLGSVLQISEIKQISSNIDSISISVEDLLIIESFKDL